jgi:hypothetical protein
LQLADKLFVVSNSVLESGTLEKRDSIGIPSTPYRIAASSISMFISFSVLNLMQYPLTLALPSSFPYVWAKYFYL